MILQTDRMLDVHSHKYQHAGTSLAAYVNSTTNPSWDGFDESFHKTSFELKALKLKDLPQRNIFERLRKAYSGIIWHVFSTDLVAACIRQRVYINRVVKECEALNCPSALSTGISRYHKFLFLMATLKKMSKSHLLLVPTLDIDLAWHTHQLFPQPYREWCIQNIGKPINHDDTMKPADGRRWIRSTSLAWLKTYNEPYTANDLRKDYFTPERIFVGLMFPPYGLFMLHVGKKLRRAGSGNAFSQ